MNWTTDKPNTPGLYLVHYVSVVHPRIIIVFENHGELWIRTRHNTKDKKLEKAFNDSTQWYGPILESPNARKRVS